MFKKLFYFLNLSKKSGKIYRFRTAHNKRFKTDSQRVAFVVCVKFNDLGGLQKHSIALLTT
ncbi:DUF3265 domain-containing protein [Vibrio parahaemolyticus]|nr:DUF3265 domain-containing protein [Vibrio parahaemolyticus]